MLLPRNAGEGDHAKHGGGGAAARCSNLNGFCSSGAVCGRALDRREPAFAIGTRRIDLHFADTLADDDMHAERRQAVFLDPLGVPQRGGRIAAVVFSNETISNPAASRSRARLSGRGEKAGLRCRRPRHREIGLAGRRRRRHWTAPARPPGLQRAERLAIEAGLVGDVHDRHSANRRGRTRRPAPAARARCPGGSSPGSPSPSPSLSASRRVAEFRGQIDPGDMTRRISRRSSAPARRCRCRCRACARPAAASAARPAPRSPATPRPWKWSIGASASGVTGASGPLTSRNAARPARRCRRCRNAAATGCSVAIAVLPWHFGAGDANRSTGRNETHQGARRWPSRSNGCSRKA